MRRLVALALVAGVACGGKSAQRSGPPDPLERLAWLDGDWQTTHWSTAGGVRYGVMLEPTRFVVLIIDQQQNRLSAITNGQAPVTMTGKSMGPQAAAFSTDDPAASMVIAMRRTGGTLHMSFDVQNATFDVDLQRNPPVTAPALEAADRARPGDRHIPIVSAAHGDVGYTVGTTATASYVTIWAKQPDGTWTVRFDTERPVTE